MAALTSARPSTPSERLRRWRLVYRSSPPPPTFGQRVALNLALLAGGQAAAEAGTRLLREAESKVRFTSASRPLPEISNCATVDAEFRLQMFLGGFGYLEAYMMGRKLIGHEEAPKSNSNRITINENSPDGDGPSLRSFAVKTLRGATSDSEKLSKKKDVNREDKVGSKKLRHEKLPRIVKSRTTVRAASRLVPASSNPIKSSTRFLLWPTWDRLSCVPLAAIHPGRK